MNLPELSGAGEPPGLLPVEVALGRLHRVVRGVEALLGLLLGLGRGRGALLGPDDGALGRSRPVVRGGRTRPGRVLRRLRRLEAGGRVARGGPGGDHPGVRGVRAAGGLCSAVEVRRGLALGDGQGVARLQARGLGSLDRRLEPGDPCLPAGRLGGSRGQAGEQDDEEEQERGPEAPAGWCGRCREGHGGVPIRERRAAVATTP